jgi:hypothetical protein
MNIKRISILCIIAVIFVSGIFLIFAASKKDTSANALGKKIIVYYFHGEFRCHTCLRIEELTQKAITGGFKKELVESKIEFKVINIDLPENGHFNKEYSLETKSVIVSEYNGSRQVRWKNLPKIWDYYSDDSMFVKYIQSEVKEYL